MYFKKSDSKTVNENFGLLHKYKKIYLLFIVEYKLAT